MYKIFISVKLPHEKYFRFNKVGTMAASPGHETRLAKELRLDAVKTWEYSAFKDTPARLSWAIYRNFEDTVPWVSSENWQG